MNTAYKLFLGSLLAISLSSSTLFASNTKDEKLLPVDAFASLPNVAQMKLSPDGEKVGYVIQLEGRKAVMVQNINGKNPNVIPAPEQGDFNTFYWANDNTVILQLSGTRKRIEFGGKAVDESRLFAFDLKTKKFKWLGEPKKKFASTNKGGGRQTFTSQLERIVDLLPDDPKNILVEMDFELDGEASVYRVNVETGRRKEIQKDLRGYQSWYTNQNSEIVFGNGYDGSTYRARFKSKGGEWVDLKKTDWYRKYSYLDFTADPNVIYVSGQNQYGTDGVFTLDLQTGAIVNEVFSHETVDIGGMAYHPITGKVAGVYFSTDFNRIKYFDKTLSKIQRSLAKALPDMIVTLVSMDKSGTKYLILASNDRDPGSYYLYDRKNKKLDYVAPTREPIFPEQMASAELVDIPVRDDTNITGVLTLPASKAPKNLPAIVLPHGGPHVDGDNAHWDYWAQFYANRGYLVLQPNFRGSTGFGRAFYWKGHKQWGGLMQDDVTDATKWLVSEGYADPERICIAGASYGGYAALMGAIKEPDLYKCAISVNGATDLPRLKSDDKFDSIGGSAWIKNMALEGADPLFTEGRLIYDELLYIFAHQLSHVASNA